MRIYIYHDTQVVPSDKTSTTNYSVVDAQPSQLNEATSPATITPPMVCVKPAPSCKLTTEQILANQRAVLALAPPTEKRGTSIQTKEVFDKEQNTVRRVFDPDTGRTRLVAI